MDIVKWMRKNNRKIIIGVLCFIMIVFVGGQALMSILKGLGRGGGQVVASYGDKGKITAIDINRARIELDVLRYLGTDMLLTAMSADSILLGQLLYPDSKIAAELSMQLKMAAMQGQLSVNDSDVDAFFKEASGRSELYWILLNIEAKEAGYVVSDEQAKMVLRSVIPQIMQGRSAAQAVQAIESSQLRIESRRTIRIFADLLGVHNYIRMITSNEDITINQLKAEIARNGITGPRGQRIVAGEEISAEFVKIEALPLVGDQTEPTGEELAKQFEAFKDFIEGRTTEDNPYAFGYKMLESVELEYIIVKFDDAKKLIDQPDQEEMENYYRRNLETMFQPMVPIDPNNPDSEKIAKTQKFAEVVTQIKQQLIREKTVRKANLIISEVKDFTEAGFLNIADLDAANSDELKAHSIPYIGAAEKLSKKFNVKLYAGRTGSLSAENLAGDRVLGSFAIDGPFGGQVQLSKIVFSVEQLGQSKLGRFDVPTPKMWESIGPVTDGYSTVAVIRVVNAQTASAPESLTASYDKKGASLETATPPKVYSVKDDVAMDCKIIKAMQAARARAAELAKSVETSGWDKAIEDFNGKYKISEASLTKIANKSRISHKQVDMVYRMATANPMVKRIARDIIKEKALIDKLYSLMPVAEIEAVNIVKVMSIEVSRNCYVVKNVSRTAVSPEDYARGKAIKAAELDAASARSVGIIHLRPSNIIKRTGFKWLSQDDDEQDRDDGNEKVS